MLSSSWLRLTLALAALAATATLGCKQEQQARRGDSPSAAPKPQPSMAVTVGETTEQAGKAEPESSSLDKEMQAWMNNANTILQRDASMEERRKALEQMNRDSQALMEAGQTPASPDGQDQVAEALKDGRALQEFATLANDLMQREASNEEWIAALEGYIRKHAGTEYARKAQAHLDRLRNQNQQQPPADE
jgi:hypothetical protein